MQERLIGVVQIAHSSAILDEVQEIAWGCFKAGSYMKDRIPECIEAFEIVFANCPASYSEENIVADGSMSFHP